ncbi:MAG: ACP phosphodiesterase [Cyanobacteriota bacterium]
MNYLAHLYLAEDSPESIIGNLLGDFIKGQRLSDYSEAIKRGIKFHQQVDIYTDSHPVFRQSKRLISSINGRYAGILIDVFYDHFLAKHWLIFSSVSLKEFSLKVYKILQVNEGILPDPLKRFLPTMIQRNLLMSYANIQGIDTALKKISLRVKRENNLGNAIEELINNYERLELDFYRFFPQLIDDAKAF